MGSSYLPFLFQSTYEDQFEFYVSIIFFYVFTSSPCLVQSAILGNGVYSILPVIDDILNRIRPKPDHCQSSCGISFHWQKILLAHPLLLQFHLSLALFNGWCLRAFQKLYWSQGRGFTLGIYDVSELSKITINRALLLISLIFCEELHQTLLIWKHLTGPNNFLPYLPCFTDGSHSFNSGINFVSHPVAVNLCRKD